MKIKDLSEKNLDKKWATFDMAYKIGGSVMIRKKELKHVTKEKNVPLFLGNVPFILGKMLWSFSLMG